MGTRGTATDLRGTTRKQGRGRPQPFPKPLLYLRQPQGATYPPNGRGACQGSPPAKPTRVPAAIAPAAMRVRTCRRRPSLCVRFFSASAIHCRPDPPTVRQVPVTDPVITHVIRRCLRWNRRRSARGQAPGVVRSIRRVTVTRSEFAGVRFPARRHHADRALVPAVACPTPGRRGATRRSRHRSGPRDRVPVGGAVRPAVCRGGPALPAQLWEPVVRWRDPGEGARPVAIPVPGGRQVRPGHGRAGVAETGQESSTAVLHPGTGRRYHAGRGDHRPGRRLPASAGRVAACRPALHRARTRTTGSRPITAGSRHRHDPCAA